MSETDFNYYLAWLLFLNGIPSLFGAVICLFWLQIVRRKVSKLIFIVGFLIFFSMSAIRFATSYNFNNYSIRLTNAIFIIVGGFISMVPFYWAYSVQKKSRKKNESLRDIIDRTFQPLNFDEITGLINALHPKDAYKLFKKYSTI